MGVVNPWDLGAALPAAGLPGGLHLCQQLPVVGGLGGGGGLQSSERGVLQSLRAKLSLLGREGGYAQENPKLTLKYALVAQGMEGKSSYKCWFCQKKIK